MLYRIHPAWAGFELTTFVMTGTYCIGSFKSNYRIITTTMAFNDLNDMYNIKDLMLLIMIMIWFSNPNLFNDFQLSHFKTETWMEQIEIHVWCPSSSMPIMFSINQFQLTNYILYIHFVPHQLECLNNSSVVYYIRISMKILQVAKQISWEYNLVNEIHFPFGQRYHRKTETR